MERLNKAHGKVTRGSIEVEKAAHLLMPELLGRFTNSIPAGTFIGSWAAIQNGKPKCGIDVFTIDQEICRFCVRGIHSPILYFWTSTHA